MGFYEQFELLELDRDDGVKTFHAREVSTGRPVKAHLFANPGAPYQAELLKKIGDLPETEDARVIARGVHLGTVYVVTDKLAEHAGLLEWVTASTKSPYNKPARATAPLRDPPAPVESAATKPASQVSLDQEFADLFPTAERAAFNLQTMAPLGTGKTPAQNSSQEATQPFKMPAATPVPESPAPSAKPVANDPNEATQPVRVLPVSSLSPSNSSEKTRPINIPPKPAISDPNEITHAVKVPPAARTPQAAARSQAVDSNETTQPLPVQAAANRPAFDPNEATQPVRVMPPSRPPKPVTTPAASPAPVDPRTQARTFTTPHRPDVPEAPPSPEAQPVAPGAPLPIAPSAKSNLPLILGIAGIAILVVLFLLFFAYRSH